MKILILMSLILVNISVASIGKITSFKGSVNINRDSQEIRAKLDLPINKHDTITTKKNSNVIIMFNDNTIITVGKYSTLIIEDYLYDEVNSINSKTQFNFIKGVFKSVTGKIGHINPDKFKLKTKSATLGIRGTVTVGNQKLVACTEGSISVKSKNKSIVLNAGEYVNVSEDIQMGIPQKLSIQVLSMLASQLGTSLKSGSDSNDGGSSLRTINKMVEESVESQAKKESDSESSSSSCSDGH